MEAELTVRPGVGRIKSASFRPELEGLRAVAIIAVVLYHCRLPCFQGGFIGVDVFFVLSGYLITRLLVIEIEREGRVDLAAFWRRRVRRLAPAQLLVIVLTLIGAAMLLLPDALRRSAITGASALAWVSNLRFLLSASDYHAAEARLDPLLHTWSLGVEAQFYLVWPLLIAAAGRHKVPVVAGVAAASLALSLILARTEPALAFYALPARLWELAAGGLLALSGLRLPAWTAVVGLVAIAVGTTLFSDATPFPGLAATVPVVGTALVIAGHPVWLGAAPLRWVGERSYSWYLWHWPLIVAADYLDGAFATRLAAAALALGLAALTFAMIETRYRSRQV